jgi:hypothetical protein
VDPSGLAGSNVALPANVAAALKEGDVGYALWLARAAALTSARLAYSRLALLILSNPATIAKIASVLTDVQIDTKSSVQGGSVIRIL